MFNIGTNLTSGPFVVGYEDDPRDFYIRGKTIHDKPTVSCRIFDSEGNLAFSMIDNKIVGAEPVELETTPNELVVRDAQGHELLRTYTRPQGNANVTYITGHFFDRSGRLAARGDERGLLVNCPLRL